MAFQSVVKFKRKGKWMFEPRVAGLQPVKCEIEKGKKYAWCTCGLSETQPFCDGKHKGTGLAPEVFLADESKTVWFCLCKKTCGKPYCDGSHKQIAETETPEL
jgi:CDGSH iron-sulfur domain-containing protein 3